MDARIFLPEVMALKDDLLRRSGEGRRALSVNSP